MVQTKPSRQEDLLYLRIADSKALLHHISVAPGQLFSAKGQFANCLRISYARPWGNEVEQGLKTLGNLIKKMI